MKPGTNLSVLLYPYDRLRPVEGGWKQMKAAAAQPGSAIVWCPTGSGDSLARAVESRPGGLSLIVVLPRASVLEANPELVAAVHRSLPRAILPHTGSPTCLELAETLRSPPLDLAAEVTDYLAWRGICPDREVVHLLRRIFDLSGEIFSVSGICRAMYVSRRAIGRRLAARGMPAPSCWLQLARVLRLSTRLQTNNETLFEIAYQLGYPDAFSASNQMHRVIGYRPSEVRARLGFDWILEAWLRRRADEGHLGGLSAASDKGARRPVLQLAQDGAQEIRESD